MSATSNNDLLDAGCFLAIDDFIMCTRGSEGTRCMGTNYEHIHAELASYCTMPSGLFPRQSAIPFRFTSP